MACHAKLGFTGRVFRVQVLPMAIFQYKTGFLITPCCLLRPHFWVVEVVDHPKLFGTFLGMARTS